MSQEAARSQDLFSDLRTRAIAGLIFAGLSALFIWIGGSVFAAFMALIAFGMLLEATRLTGTECALEDLPRLIMSALGGFSVFVLAHSALGFAVLAILGLVIAAVINQAALGRMTLAGYALVVLGAASAVHLRGLDGGLTLVLWIVICVAAADIGGYAFGRTFQGPKLIPSVSPKKTWSGALGGMLLAAAAAMLVAAVAGGDMTLLVVFGLLISVISVMGDLLESVAKRRFGVKDAGAILPGHGGLIDRLDGMTLVMLVFGALSLILDLSGVFSLNYAAPAGGL